MKNKFQKCLEKKKIAPFSRGPKLSSKEIRLAGFDFNRSRASFEDKDYKWATIQSYYSMFHSARALLYLKSYRERSHQCLIEAIRSIYLDKGLLDYTIVEALQRAKTLREEADYYGEFSRESADYLISKAEEFLKKGKETIKKN